MKKVIGVLGIMLALGMMNESYANLGDSASDLVYTPVSPCRIIDTRLIGASGTMISTTTPMSFWVAGTGGFENQGGRLEAVGYPRVPRRWLSVLLRSTLRGRGIFGPGLTGVLHRPMVRSSTTGLFQGG
jgi:hypothetical protein